MKRATLPAMLSDLAARLGGRLEGPDALISTLAPIDGAGAGALTFYADGRYARHLEGLVAGGLLTAAARSEVACGQIVIEDPAGAFYALARQVALRPAPAPGVHPRAWVSEGASVHASAHVGPLAVVEAKAEVGADAILYAQSYVGPGCVIGEGAVLHPGAKVLGGSVVEAGAILHPGACVGSSGFGFHWDGSRHAREPQLGQAYIGVDSEIGANACVDRAAFGLTRVGPGARVDNLVQIGHGAQVGAHAVLCAQVGLAGSSQVGAGAMLGGQAGVADHGVVGEGAQVAAQGGVARRVAPGQQVGGSPAMPIAQWRRAVVALARLPGALRRLRALEKRVQGLVEAAER